MKYSDPLSGVQKAARMILESCGEFGRQGTEETPARFEMAMVEYLSGYSQDPGEILKTFEDGAARYDEMVFVGNAPLWSMCEHHLAPFWGIAHIGYITRGRIVGLSKLPRLVECFARRLQVQERLTTQIADALTEHLSPDVAVVLRCRHMCMEARGICKQGTITYTSAVRGAIKESPSAREEFLHFVKMSEGSGLAL